MAGKYTMVTPLKKSIRKGSIWKANDKRQGGRCIEVVGLNHSFGTVLIKTVGGNGRIFEVNLSSFNGRNRGYSPL